MLKAKLGMSPIAWWNDDLPQLSDDVSLENASGSRARRASPAWRRARFPESAAEMLPILKKADVTLCGGWFSGTIVRQNRSRPTSSASSR
jgi:inosose dehydratase